jgi:hypothetical protein
MAGRAAVKKTKAKRPIIAVFTFKKGFFITKKSVAFNWIAKVLINAS